jgi:pimeloyl-ACP methyl ester carboxylesterase
MTIPPALDNQLDDADPRSPDREPHVGRARRRRRRLIASVIFGEQDRAVAGARVELLPGAGHSPMFEDPPRTTALLRTFTSSVLSGQ